MPTQKFFTLYLNKQLYKGIFGGANYASDIGF